MTSFRYSELIYFIKPLQLEAFREAFDYLSGATLTMNSDRIVLGCHQLETIDQLNDDREILGYLAWLKTGLQRGEVYFLQQLIFAWQYDPTCDQEVLSETSTCHSNAAMTATATLEKPATEATVPVVSAPKKTAPVTSPCSEAVEAASQLIAVERLVTQISSLSGRSPESVRAEIMQSAALYVASDAAIALIDRQIATLQEMRSKLSATPAAPEPTNGQAAAKPAATKATPAKKPTNSKNGSRSKTTAKTAPKKTAPKPKPEPVETEAEATEA